MRWRQANKSSHLLLSFPSFQLAPLVLSLGQLGNYLSINLSISHKHSKTTRTCKQNTYKQLQKHILINTAVQSAHATWTATWWGTSGIAAEMPSFTRSIKCSNTMIRITSKCYHYCFDRSQHISPDILWKIILIIKGPSQVLCLSSWSQWREITVWLPVMLGKILWTGPESPISPQLTSTAMNPIT